jgi:hypothetical protein
LRGGGIQRSLQPGDADCDPCTGYNSREQQPTGGSQFGEHPLQVDGTPELLTIEWPAEPPGSAEMEVRARARHRRSTAVLTEGQDYAHGIQQVRRERGRQLEIQHPDEVGRKEKEEGVIGGRSRRSWRSHDHVAESDDGADPQTHVKDRERNSNILEQPDVSPFALRFRTRDDAEERVETQVPQLVERPHMGSEASGFTGHHVHDVRQT